MKRSKQQNTPWAKQKAQQHSLPTAAPNTPETDSILDPRLRYNRPKHGFLKELLHPLQAIGVAPFHLYLRDGKHLLDQLKYEDAYTAYHMAQRRDPKRIEPYIGMARALEGLGGKEEVNHAVEFLKKAITIDPMRLELYEELVRILAKHDRMDEAQAFKKKQFTAKTLRANPDNALALNNMGVLYMSAHEYDQAIAFFRRAIKAKRGLKLAHVNLAKAWYYKAEHSTLSEEKETCYHHSLQEAERTPGHGEIADLWVLKGKVAFHRNRLEEARSCLMKAKTLDDTLKEIYATLQLVEEKLGNVSAANDAYDTYRSLRNI